MTTEKPSRSCGAPGQPAFASSSQVNGLKSETLAMISSSRSTYLFAHDLFGKPLHTFPDHALALAAAQDAAGRRLRGVARGLAAFRCEALVDAAGQAIDQPGAFLVRAVEPDIAGAERGDQCREQDRSRDHRGPDQDRHRCGGTRLIRRTRAISLVLTLL